MSTFGMLPHKYSFSFPTPLCLKYGGQILKNMDVKEHPVICLFGKRHFQLAVVPTSLVLGSQRPRPHWLAVLGNNEWCHPLSSLDTASLAWNRHCFLAAASKSPDACNLSWMVRQVRRAPCTSLRAGWGRLPCFFCCVLCGPSMIRMSASFG